MTGLTAQEFTALLPPFEHAWLAYMEDHTLDGHPRTSRRYSTYATSPLPTMADKLLVIAQPWSNRELMGDSALWID